MIFFISTAARSEIVIGWTSSNMQYIRATKLPKFQTHLIVNKFYGDRRRIWQAPHPGIGGALSFLSAGPGIYPEGNRFEKTGGQEPRYRNRVTQPSPRIRKDDAVSGANGTTKSAGTP